METANNLLSNYYGINKQSSNNDNPKLMSYLGNTIQESKLSLSSSTSVDESSQNYNDEVTNPKNEDAAHNLLKARVIDEELDKEIDCELSLQDLSLGVNEDKANLNQVNEEVTNDRGQIAVYPEDLQETYSEVSSTVRLKSRRGGKSEREGSVVAIRSRIDPEVLKKIPVFNNNFCDMSNNDLKEFPVDLIDRICNIKMLYLGNNFLTSLPDELFEKLKFLEWLDVRNNKLSTLPKGIKHHKALETILLQGNEIERLPEELCTLENLKAVNIGGCVFPPPEVWKKGFKEVMEVLRKEWNKSHPEEYIPRKDQKLPILSQDIFWGSKRPKLKPQRPRSPKNLRFRRLNYKPSNKCPQSRKLLCQNCVNSLTKPQNQSLDSPKSEEGYQLKVHMVKSKKKNKEFLENQETYLGLKNLGPHKQDLALLVNLEKEEERSFERGKIRTNKEKVNLPEEINRIEDIQVKERVYNVITNDRLVTKLRPMRLSDPNWLLGFVENYLGFNKQTIAPYTGFKKL